MGRPKTTDVVARMIAENNKQLLAQIAQMVGGKSPTTTTGNASLTPAQGGTPKAAVQPKVKRERVERMPEGGYADRYVVVPADAGGEALPKGVPAEILAGNFNIYFWRESDGESVAPHPQYRTLLKGARFTYAGSYKRWFGRKSELPAELRDGIRARRNA